MTHCSGELSGLSEKHCTDHTDNKPGRTAEPLWILNLKTGHMQRLPECHCHQSSLHELTIWMEIHIMSVFFGDSLFFNHPWQLPLFMVFRCLLQTNSRCYCCWKILGACVCTSADTSIDINSSTFVVFTLQQHLNWRVFQFSLAPHYKVNWTDFGFHSFLLQIVEVFPIQCRSEETDRRDGHVWLKSCAVNSNRILQRNPKRTMRVSWLGGVASWIFCTC